MDLQIGPIVSNAFFFSSMMLNSRLMSFDKVILRVCFVVGKISSAGAGCGEGPHANSGEMEKYPPRT
jgi:hypothetical protein